MADCNSLIQPAIIAAVLAATATLTGAGIAHFSSVAKLRREYLLAKLEGLAEAANKVSLASASKAERSAADAAVSIYQPFAQMLMLQSLYFPQLSAEVKAFKDAAISSFGIPAQSDASAAPDPLTVSLATAHKVLMLRCRSEIANILSPRRWYHKK